MDLQVTQAPRLVSTPDVVGQPLQKALLLIERVGLPVIAPRLDLNDNAGRYLELMRVDKKAESGAIRFVVIDGPSRAALRAAPDDVVRDVIDACCA